LLALLARGRWHVNSRLWRAGSAGLAVGRTFACVHPLGSAEFWAVVGGRTALKLAAK